MDESNTGQQQQQAIYKESTNKSIVLKAFIGITIFMVLVVSIMAFFWKAMILYVNAMVNFFSSLTLAVLFCIIVGAKDNRGELWLLIINLAISSYVTLTLCYWFRQGELASDKVWFLILVASILIFQTITTDVYVFNPYEPPKPTQAPTIRPLTTVNTTTTPPQFV